MQTDTKTCRACDTVKPVGEFQRDKQKPDGYQSNCKACRNGILKQQRRGAEKLPEGKRREMPRRRPEHPDLPSHVPTVLDGTRQGPWIWRVRDRFLVTAVKARPRNAGHHETRRCHIVGDYPTMDDALEGARFRRKNIHQFRQNARAL